MIQNSLTRLWNEQEGAIISAEIVLVMTILVIGMIVGLTSFRDAVVTELADVGQALANLNQSFSFGGIIGHCGSTSGAVFIDTFDFCDTAATEVTTVCSSRCVVVCGAGTTTTEIPHP